MSGFGNSDNLDLDNESDLQELARTSVRTTDISQTILGHKTFENVTIHDLSVNSQTTFATEDGIIHQLKDNTSDDLLDYGNYATYRDGTVKYKGLINKAGTDKFYVFHNQTTEPAISLNLNTQSLGTICVREPTQANEVATKAYVESHGGGNYLPLSGGNMTGSIDMGGKDITNLNTIKYNDGQGTNNHLTFRDTSKLTFGAWNTSNNNIDPYIHLNDNDFNKLIEIMKDVNLHGNINVLDNKRITGLQTPTSNSEPATKEYTDTALNSKLNLSGGTMSGDINMDTNDILNANKISLKPTTPGGNTFIDFIAGDGGRGKLFISGMGRMEISTANQEFTRFQLFQKLQMDDKIYFSSPYKIENLADGTNSRDAVNKAQLDTKLNLSGGTMLGNIDMGGNDLINCDIVRPQGTSLQLLSQNQIGGIRIFNTLLDVFSDIRMNGNNISFLADGINDKDAVNLKQLKEFKKQAFNLTGSSSNEGIGTHTFILPEIITTNTDFLISIDLKMNFTGTFAASNQIGATLRQLQDNDALITSTTDNFYVNINDLGSFKFINGISKTIITALPNTKKIEIDLVDNYTSGTSKTFNHMLEIEKL